MAPLSEYLSPSRVVQLESSTPKQAIELLVETLREGEEVTRRDLFFFSVWKREQVMSTGVGEGIALPHARTNEVKRPFIALGISRAGIDFNAPDRKPAHFVALIGAPERHTAEYLQMLSRVLGLFVQPELRDRLIAAGTPQDAVRLIAQSES